jgi:hypothetical protein
MTVQPGSVNCPPKVIDPALRSAINVDLCPPITALPFSPCALSRPAAKLSKARIAAGETFTFLTSAAIAYQCIDNRSFYGIGSRRDVAG